MKYPGTRMMLLAALLLFAADIMAQVPQGFNFQAVARDSNGEVIANTELAVRITVLQGSETGTAVYSEVQSPGTSVAGSFQIIIGEGTSEDDFGAIDWSADNYFVKLEMDASGGTEYEELGTTRLLSVPYALVAQNVINGSETGNTGAPIELTGTNGKMNVNISNTGTNNNYGVLELGDDNGDALVKLEVPHDSSGSVGFGRLRLSSKDGKNVRLFPNNLYFSNPEIVSDTPIGWFGTLAGSSGFSQLLAYNAETKAYKGGILTGFWPGEATILLEDENSTPLVQLQTQTQETRNVGMLTLRGTDGTEFSITSDGINGSSANSQTLDSLLVATGPDVNFQRKTNFYPGYIRHSGQDGDFSTLSRKGLQYGNNGVEDVFNWFSKGSMQIAHQNYTNGERATGINPGYFYMDIHKNGNFYIPLNFGVSNDSSGGKPFFNMNSLTRLENGQGDLLSMSVSQDLNGNDPNGQAGHLMMFGQNSPNIQMGGQTWESSDLGYLQLWGNTQDGNGWYLNNAFFGVATDGADEWGSLSLMKTNIAGQTSVETIKLDGLNGDITISGSLSQSSDERLKKNIQTLDDALTKTTKLRGVSYTWKTDEHSEHPQVGVIAQEVEKIYPEFVYTDDKGMKSVNYAQMTAVLIEAVKALDAKIHNLEKENALLSAKLDKKSELEQRLAQIEHLLGVASSDDVVKSAE